MGRKEHSAAAFESKICHNCFCYINPELALVAHPLLAPRIFCSDVCLRKLFYELYLECAQCSKMVFFDKALHEESIYCSAECLQAGREELSFEAHEEGVQEMEAEPESEEEVLEPSIREPGEELPFFF